MPEGRHEKGGTHRASRGSRHHATARGVCDDHTALRPARLAGDRPHRGSGCRAGVVSPDLSHRAEDRPGMVEVKPSAVSRRLAAWLVLLAGPRPGHASLFHYRAGRGGVGRTGPQPVRDGRTRLAPTRHAARPRPKLDLAYVTTGAMWEAVYQVVLTGAGCQLSGAATITSQSLRADTAEVQLVAGSISRARAPAQPRFDYVARGVAAAEVREEARVVSEQAVGETHVYQLPGRLSFEPGVPVTTALFPRAGVSYTQDFVIPGALPWRGFLGQSPAEPNRVPVEVWYTVKRARGTAFGNRPLPGGTVQLYQADSAGRVQLVGEARSEHTAPGRDLRGQSGEAFHVTAERVPRDYNQEQLPPPRRGLPPRQPITAAYKVTITNAN